MRNEVLPLTCKAFRDLGSEIRCYIRDPDGRLIGVGQTTAE
jgi:hypothetical protein